MFFQHVLPFSAFQQPTTTIIQPTTTYGNFSGFRQPTKTYDNLLQATTTYDILRQLTTLYSDKFWIFSAFAYTKWEFLWQFPTTYIDNSFLWVYHCVIVIRYYKLLLLSVLQVYWYFRYVLLDNSLQTVFCCTSCTILREKWKHRTNLLIKQI